MSVPSKVSPFITRALSGTLRIRGRAILPSEIRPVAEHGLALRWGSTDAAGWVQFEAEGATDPSAPELQRIWFGGAPVRFDETSWKAPDHLGPDEWLGVAHVVSDDGVPVALEVDAPVSPAELDELTTDAVRAFGPSWTLGEWRCTGRRWGAAILAR